MGKPIIPVTAEIAFGMAKMAVAILSKQEAVTTLRQTLFSSEQWHYDGEAHRAMLNYIRSIERDEF